MTFIDSLLRSIAGCPTRFAIMIPKRCFKSNENERYGGHEVIKIFFIKTFSLK